MNAFVYVIIVLFEIVFLFSIFIYLSSLIYSSFRGSPYVPTKYEVIEALLKKAELKKGVKFLELGCGDGRVTRIAVERFGVNGTGVDINGVLIFFARWKSRFIPRTQITFYRKNAFDVDISSFDVIYLFLMPEMLTKLKSKLESEHKKKSVFISHGFQIEGWRKYLYKTLPGKQFATYFYRLTD